MAAGERGNGVARLLFLVNSADFFLSHRLPIAIAARNQGYDVHVATPHSASISVLREHGLVHHGIPLTRSSARVTEEVRAVAAITALFRRVAPTIVHTVTLKPVLYGGIAARIARVPAIVHAVSGLGYVFMAEGLRASTRRRAVLAAYALAFRHPNQKVIFQNGDDRAELGRTVADSDVAMISGSGVDLDVFSPALRMTVPSPGPVRIVMAARLLRDKGIVEFVEAARIVKSRGRSVEFVLAGKPDDGNPAAVSASEVRGWNDAGVLRWLGHRTDMAAVWRDADIACLPSYREGTPKSLLEAAACGLPIVTTDVPGCREVVHAGENGRLVPARDAAALAEALDALVLDEASRREMGQRSRERAIESFGVRAVESATLAIYEELVGRVRA
ncbi:MAG: glycosyltransferase family 4 protein [Polyangiaceae bacterium]